MNLSSFIEFQIHTTWKDIMRRVNQKRKAEWDAMMKTSICDAAENVLNEHGIEGLKMGAVAKTAEIATGTLYNYFSDKDSLVIHMIENKFIATHQELIPIINSTLSARDKLEKLVCTLMDVFKSDRNFVAVVYNAKMFSETVKKYTDDKKKIMLKILSEIIDEGIRTNYFKQIDPALISRIIYGGIVHLFLTNVEDTRPLTSIDDEVSVVVSFFLTGLAPINRDEEQI